MATPRTELGVVFGTMTFGKQQGEGIRVTDPSIMAAMVDAFQAHGHAEIDSARVYGGGTSEETFADLHWQDRGLIMATKLYPTGRAAMAALTSETYTHGSGDVRRGLLDSLKALEADKIDMFYLHGPDRQTPFEETLKEVNDLYKEGYFKRFGISNYMSWEVAQISEICIRNDWIRPTVYQGVYNALHRAIEPELMTCLRKYGMSLYAFQPLAGGFLTGRYRPDMKDDEYEAGSRFDPKKWQGRLHHGRYINDCYFEALEVIRPEVEKAGLTMTECALRWMSHHSEMKRARGDKVIIGASSAKQLEENMEGLEKGPLPEEIVQAMEAGWLRVKGVVPKYWH
ncbi:NADP-dependent oxidoreductase domain-containing protein [Dactylonectria estremocensis]|uniref:NADP-dependent oxidoreductase domain-containing protein n=1 Tax=Dactylonectria estremocensis TaxID=1079267 RepID=A0A9P9ELQ6_9HYPO|nr:NADP-dependent oxidoreductase domain-containing protein [Dactylonectria estremocensis]